MSNLIDLTLSELVTKIKSKEILSTEVTKAYIERSKLSKKLNTYVEETFEKALENSKNLTLNLILTKNYLASLLQ